MSKGRLAVAMAALTTSAKDLANAIGRATVAADLLGDAMPRPKKRWTPPAQRPRRQRARNRPKVSKRQRRSGHHGRRSHR